MAQHCASANIRFSPHAIRFLGSWMQKRSHCWFNMIARCVVFLYVCPIASLCTLLVAPRRTLIFPKDDWKKRQDKVEMEPSRGHEGKERRKKVNVPCVSCGSAWKVHGGWRGGVGHSGLLYLRTHIGRKRSGWRRSVSLQFFAIRSGSIKRRCDNINFYLGLCWIKPPHSQPGGEAGLAPQCYYQRNPCKRCGALPALIWVRLICFPLEHVLVWRRGT